MVDVIDKVVISYLRSPVAIRERCSQLFSLACSGQLQYFHCNLNRLDCVAAYVIQVLREKYPNLVIPFHSRWRHFEEGDGRRLARLEEKLSRLSPLERAYAKFDLVFVSVLLDAGAGNRWQYREPMTGKTFNRSEGLAVASFDLFFQGVFSSEPNAPLQVDADGLKQLTETALSRGFQVSTNNPLIGVRGRVKILQKLGQILQHSPHLFGSQNPRPGHLVNYLLSQAQDKQLAASKILTAVLEGLGAIWPERTILKGLNLGDVWFHPALSGEELQSKLVPFHKLSQWLTYSLLEPLQELGLEITELDGLTGLPEYRNGGLCLDLGLLQVKDSSILHQKYLPGSEVVVEWRALTVVILDRIADSVRQQLNLTIDEMPLVKVLQGGTWAAGRRIATELRGGAPPIQVESDGTIF